MLLFIVPTFENLITYYHYKYDILCIDFNVEFKNAIHLSHSSFSQTIVFDYYNTERNKMKSGKIEDLKIY